MIAKTSRETRTATAKKSSVNPSALPRPIAGTKNVFWKRSPYASRIVNSKTVNPQKTNACAMPGIVRLKSFF